MIIDPRFNGPPTSGNGGVSCGLVSVATGLPQVTLRLPPPLGVELVVADDKLFHGEAVVAEAAPGSVTAAPPPAVSVAEAFAARAGFRGRDDHPYPTCFVCGTARSDGLGLTPGPVAGDVVAVDWTPAGQDPVMLWAALDCPGGWSVDLPGRPMVLGRMTLRLDELPTAGEAHVVQGWVLGLEGRKARTGSALYDASGRVLAVAEATWIAIA